MESDNESFNLEDLPMFFNSVLEKTQLICREENVDFEHSGNRSVTNKDGGLQTTLPGVKYRLRVKCSLQTKGKMKTRGKMQNEDHRLQCKPGGNERKDSRKYVCVCRSS